ncbi:universal stress protein [Candidatus Obscuribacterales bacterium]|nr:universal stress protein [Candidatus Obscuribacterales bacterium]
MNVLIAVDQADFARAIANFVVNHTWKPDTKFIIMSVVKPTKLNKTLAVLPGPLLDEIEEKQFAAARELVHKTANSIKQKLAEQEIEEIVIEGFPNEDLVAYARENAIDMIVMGSHGRTEIGRLFLGSVSMAVISHAPCSVAIVHLDKLEEQETAADGVAERALTGSHKS